MKKQFPRRVVDVSVVVPVYNEITVIRSCLDALSNQTVDFREIVVVDNNSRDGSIDICREYPNVRIVKESRQGIIYARIAGLDKAKGDLIATIDADTVVAPNWVECIDDAFKRDTELLAVGGPVGYKELSLPGTHIGKLLYHLTVRRADARRYDLATDRMLYGHNMAVRRSAYQVIRPDMYVGPDGVEALEDIEMTILLSRLGKTAFNKRMVVNVHGLRALDMEKIRRYQELGRKTVARHQ